MNQQKTGEFLKYLRKEKGLTQEQLARKIAGLSANDISEAERGLKDLTQEQLKQIAKITGVTQASLINAAKGSSAKKTSSTGSSSSSSSKTSYMVTAEEKKLIQLYRKADTATKSGVMNLLKVKESATEMILEGLMDHVQDLFSGKK